MVSMTNAQLKGFLAFANDVPSTRNASSAKSKVYLIARELFELPLSRSRELLLQYQYPIFPFQVPIVHRSCESKGWSVPASQRCLRGKPGISIFVIAEALIAFRHSVAARCRHCTRPRGTGNVGRATDLEARRVCPTAWVSR